MRGSEHFMVLKPHYYACYPVWRRRIPALADVARFKPKQFHKLVNDKTLLTNTLERVDQRARACAICQPGSSAALASNRC
jgi:hypothetical protein